MSLPTTTDLIRHARLVRENRESRRRHETDEQRREREFDEDTNPSALRRVDGSRLVIDFDWMEGQ